MGTSELLLPEEALTLRSRHIIDDDDGPLPIKSTVGMVLDGLTVAMTIPGEVSFFDDLSEHTQLTRTPCSNAQHKTGSPASRYLLDLTYSIFLIFLIVPITAIG